MHPQSFYIYPQPTSMAESYCQYIRKLDTDNVHRIYHDHHYGFPIQDDNALFERLVLEINQAGLSWDTILRKQENFKKAYLSFDIKKVADFKEKDIQRLLNDAGIIRNRLKINAAIFNANAIIEIQKEYGSFKNWLDAHHPQNLDAWVKLFRKHFKFTGTEIVNEMLMSTGYLAGAHVQDCPVFKKILLLNPPFLKPD